MSNEVSRQVNIEKNLMINVINCSMMESKSTYDFDERDNGDYKSTVLERTIKHSIKETSLGCRAAHNLVTRGQNIRVEISLMVKGTLKATRG